jgi:uncharacterized protein YeaO (DUF488 family)
VAIRIVRLGTDRLPDEGIRVGTVRRPPRGVLKAEYASKNFYDVWLPTLAPSPGLVKQALASQTERDWHRFVKKYRLEMAATNERSILYTLAALSHQANFSVGCALTKPAAIARSYVSFCSISERRSNSLTGTRRRQMVIV